MFLDPIQGIDRNNQKLRDPLPARTAIRINRSSFGLSAASVAVCRHTGGGQIQKIMFDSLHARREADQ
jgi:hypothetical protein